MLRKYKSNTCWSYNRIISNAKVATFRCLNNALRAVVNIFLIIIIEKVVLGYNWDNEKVGPKSYIFFIYIILIYLI